MFVDTERLLLKRRVPLNALVNIALDETDGHLRGLLDGFLDIMQAENPITEKNHTYEATCKELCCNAPEPLFAVCTRTPYVKDVKNDDIDKNNHKGKPKDACDVDHLDQRREKILGIAEVLPGKPR